MTHLPLSGVLDAPTLHQMALPRCGTHDGHGRAAGAPPARRRRTARHGEHQGSRWALGSGVLGSAPLELVGKMLWVGGAAPLAQHQPRIHLVVIFKAFSFRLVSMA